MANLQYLPITLVGSIQNGSVSLNTFYNNAGSIYNGYGYTFNATLDILLTFNSDDRLTPTPNVYDANQIVPGMWFGQGNGLAYRIESIVSLNSNTQVEVILKDVGLFNLLSDPSFSGINTPIENNNGIIFNLSDDGDPIISGIEFLRPNLPDISYWINDFYARFQYRNLTTTYYNNNDTNLVYSSGYSINQIVYLDSTGQFQLVDTTNSTQVEKSFGIITSVNEPEDGNMTVKPFGEIKGGLTLTGFSIGDILYYDATASSTSFVTNVKPTTNPLPIYIKISDTTGSLIGGQTSGGSGSSGVSGTSGTSGSDGSSGTSGVDGVSGTSGTSGSNGTDGTSGTSGVDGVSGTSGTSGDSLFTEVSPGVWETINNIQITGSLNVDGIITAKELHIDYVTSSVLYTSGSTKFGDTSDDTHEFTGSLFISGSVNITSGSLIIDGVPFSAMTSGTSGSNGTDGSSGTSGSDGSSGTSGVDGVSGTSGTSGSNGTDGSSGSSGISGVDGTDGSSGTSGVDGVSGTSGTSGSNGTDGTSGISGVDGTDGSSGTSGVDGVSGTSGTSGSNGTDGSSGSSGISGVDGTDGSSGSSGTSGVDGVSGTSGTSGSNGTDGSSGSNGTDGTSGSNGTDGTSGTDGSSGSNGTDGSSGTSGDSLFAETGSFWATTNDVQITGSLYVSNTVYAESGSFNYIHTTYETSSVIYSSGSTKFGDTFDDTHTFTGSVNITGSITLNGQAIGTGKLDETVFNAYTSSITSSFSGTSSYALTALYAENAVIVSGANKQLYVSSPSTTWSFTHNLHERYPVINVFDSNGYIVVPETIKSVDQDRIEVYFNTPETGHVVASVGGAGTSGTSGSNGTDGSSGTSGSNGTDGTSGSNGTDGTSGSNGTDGSSGSSGSNGTDGSSGTSGVDGVSGTSGTSGSNGSDGSSGTSGVDGVSGTSGTSGSNGTDGTSGSSGISGVNGTDGSSGTSGVDGVSGTSGTSGSNGSDGSSGTSGDSLFAQTGSFWATTNDIQITGSLTVGQGTDVVNSYLFLTDSSSLILTSGSNIIVENGGYVTAAFFGDGAGLYNIPASGVTGLELNKIVSGNASASINDTGLYVNRDLYVDGIITAKELHIDYVTSSVLYQSGSTNFGDTSDDTHTFTGSLFISGSVNITSGSLVIDGVPFSSMTSGTSGSNGTDGTSGSNGTDGSSGSSGTSGVDGVSGTSGTSGSNGTDGSSGTSGVDGVSGTSGTSGSNGTDGSSGSSGISGINGTDGSSGTSGVDGVSGTSGTSGSNGTDGSSGTSGSNGTDGTSGTDGSSGSNGTDGSSGTSGDSLFAQTGSMWATTNDLEITGSVKIKGVLTAEEYNITLISSSVLYSSGSTKFGDTFDDNHNFTGSVNITGSLSLNGQPVGVGKLDETWFNNYVSGSSSQFAGTSSYAIYAENAVIVSGANKQLYVSSPSTTWSFTHNLHERYPVINVFDSNGYIVIPETIRSVDQDTIEVYFNTPETGHVVASVGGAGTSGTSGSNGTDGSSGTSGSNGTDGTSGSNGTDGSSGSNGTDGTSGTSGATGISAGQIYYFNQSTLSDIGTYRDLDIYPTAASQTGLTVTLPGSTNEITVSTFITPELGFNVIPGGTQRFHLHFLKQASNDHLYAQVKIQLTDSSGTPIGPEIISTPSLIGWNDSVTSVEVQTDLVLPTTTIDPTNRMLVTVMVDNVDSNQHTVIWYTEGNTAYSFVLTSVGAVAGTSGTSGDSLFAQTGSFWSTTNDIQITGSLDVNGIITAKEIHTSYVTSSVLYESGSTKFGDTLDDTHQFTGSLYTTGSVVINGDLTVNGTTILTATDPLRESLIISGAMAIVHAQIQAQIISASLAMGGQQVIAQQNNINVMDLGGF